MKKMHLAALAFSIVSFSPAAIASEWGCQVLLCLANPAGPMAAAACVPPIQKLWAALNKTNPDPFPTCEEANNSSNGNSFAKQGSGFFDNCPSGTRALSRGLTAVQLPASAYADLTKATSGYFGTMQASTRAAMAAATPAFGIGEGDGLQPTSEQVLPNKVCVSGELGAVILPGVNVEDGPYQTVAYRQVVSLPPLTSSRYIDVFVNGKLFNRVRY